MSALLILGVFVSAVLGGLAVAVSPWFWAVFVGFYLGVLLVGLVTS